MGTLTRARLALQERRPRRVVPCWPPPLVALLPLEEKVANLSGKRGKPFWQSTRTVYVLAEIEGLPQHEIATLLAVSVDTVKTRLHRARLRLRQALADYFAEQKPTAAGRTGHG